MMALLASYPIEATAIQSYIGQPVAAYLHSGDIVYGNFDRIVDGNLVLSPLTYPTAGILNVKSKIKSHPAVKAHIKKMKLAKNQIKVPKSMQGKVRTKAWGGYGGYGYGWGYGDYGWGAGSWWLWALLGIAFLFAFPFFW